MENERASSVSVGDRSYPLDEHGFLRAPEEWDEDFAEAMAATLGIEGGLSEEHWKFVRYLRQKYTVGRELPAVVFACRDNGLTLRGFRRLFPTGYFRGVCKIAGVDHDFICATNVLATYETDWSAYDRMPDLAKRYELTPCGFLANFAAWDREFASAVALEWQLPGGLTERHWGIIRFLRDFYAEHDRVPTIYETCKPNDLSPREFEELFPRGYRRGACRIAGLPYV